MSESTYDKPFKTYSEMIEILEARNIIVVNKEFAAQAFSNFSYYSIVNGYKNTFLTTPGTDVFVSGTKFEDLYYLNIIDTDLNNILFKYILYIEKSLKSKLSFRISEQYGVFTDKSSDLPDDIQDYLHISHYRNSTGMRINVINKLKKCIDENRDKKIIKHYITEKNHIPAWILTTVIPFGLAISWYRILCDSDKKYICEVFIPDLTLDINRRKEYLIKSLDLSKSYRNIIAHGSKIISLSNLPILPKEQTIKLAGNLLTEEEYNHKLGQNDIYSIFIIILTLLSDETLLRDFYTDFYVFHHKYEDFIFNNKTIFKVFGLPEDILKRMEIFLVKKLSIELTTN